MLRRRRATLPRLLKAISLIVVLLPVAAHAEQKCDLRELADRTKAISKLAAFQDGLNFLAISQSVAVIEIETGNPVWPIHVEESTFFGPFVGLRKHTDKTETYLNNLDKDIRRLASFERLEGRYGEIATAKTSLVEAGYEILARLEDKDFKAARSILTSTTLPVLEDVRGDIYTTISNLEKSVAIDALRCQ